MDAPIAYCFQAPAGGVCAVWENDRDGDRRGPRGTGAAGVLSTHACGDVRQLKTENKTAETQVLSLSPAGSTAKPDLGPFRVWGTETCGVQRSSHAPRA